MLDYGRNGLDTRVVVLLGPLLVVMLGIGVIDKTTTAGSLVQTAT